MKIHTGDFGFQTPGPAGRADAPAGAFVTQGVPELGAAGLKLGAEGAQAEAQDAQLASQVARGERIQAEHEAKLIAREAKRAEAMTIHAKAQNALADAHDQLRAGIQTGTIPVDAAPKLWAEQSAKIVDEHLKGVDKSNTELVRAGLAGNVGTFGRSLNEAVTVRNRHEIGAKLNDYLEEMQRFAASDLPTAKKQGTMAIDAQAPLAGYNAEQVSKMRHGFVETLTFNSANNYLASNKDNRKALDGFVKSLPQMQDLDPAKKNILLSQANSAIMHLDNKALAAENRRLVQLQRLGTQFETRIAMGIPVNPNDLAAYVTAAKGTVFEESATGLIDEQNAVTDLLKRPPAQQAAYVADLRTKLVTTGEGNPKLVARLEKTVANTITMLEKNPLQYAMDRGGAKVELLELTKPDSWAANLGNRSQILAAQQKQIGGAAGALFPQEAATLSHILATGTPEQKKAYLEPMRRGLADDNVFRATMQQIAKDSPVTALAATIATKEAPITDGTFFKSSYLPGDTSARLLLGEHLLNPTKGDKAQDGKNRGFPMPKGPDEKAMEQRFNDAVGEVFAGSADAYSTQMQAARAYYATLLNEKGNFSGELDTRAWQQAITATLPVVKYNGKPVAAPWGMDEGTFKDKVANAFPQALKAAGLPVDMAGATGRYTLQNLSGNRYLVRQGTEYLAGPKGKVVISVPDLPTSYRTPEQRSAMQVPQ